MSTFADIERFATQHATCGTLTPSTSNATKTGYQLTVTCSCGATHSRWVTGDETDQAAGAPPSAPPKPEGRAAPKPVPTVVVPPRGNESLEDVMKEALDAIEAAPTKPLAPPAAPTPTTTPTTAPVAEPSKPKPATTPPAPRPTAPSPSGGAKPVRPKPDKQALQEALKETLEAFDSSPDAAPEPVARPGPHGQPRLHAQPKRGAAAGEMSSKPAAKRRRRRGGALAVVVLMMLGAGAGAAWYIIAEPELGGGAATPVTRPRLPVPAEDRLVIGRALSSLKEVQGATTSDLQFRNYFNRVSFTKADVDRSLQMAKDSEAKSALREAMALHMLAASAWRAKTLNDPTQLEPLGDDPAIELCPLVKRNLSVADEPPPMTRKQWRGLALAASVPLLWDCAGERLGEVDRALK